MVLFLHLVAVVACASAQTGSTVPTVEAIVARMAQARAENRARFRPYIVTRDYQLFGKERDKTKSQVIADVAFVPPDSKKYTIQQTNGSGLGGMIVRRMLASEAEVTKDYARPSLDKQRLGELIDLIGTIGLGDAENRSKDILGRVYEHFLGQFASAEGKKGGEFYTPRCVVKPLVEKLEAYKTQV